MSQTEQKTSVNVFVNRRKIELPVNVLTGAQLLAAAGFEGEKWDLLRLHGEGDPTGGVLVPAQEELDLKNGERFRVIPGERTFGGC
jgi:hypothetical protein